MKRLLPGLDEMAILCTLAALCTAIAYSMPHRDLALSALAIPLFITCSVMGMRRCERYAPVRETVEERIDSTERAG